MMALSTSSQLIPRLRWSHQPTVSELDGFYAELSKAGKPVILSIIPKYCDAYIPQYRINSSMPKPLTDLYMEEYTLMAHEDLLQKCQITFDQLSVTSHQAAELEKQTRSQAKSKLWFAHRAGRITASKFKSAVRTRLSYPSQSLIKSICYPDNARFTSDATEWGSSHEAHALEAYKLIRRKEHDHSFTISSSGLVVNTSWPYLGASPDAIVNCTCCGKGVVEIKCPYTCINKTFLDVAGTAGFNFCLEIVNSECNELKLKPDHAYYYQVQLQMLLCDVKYADFVVWRPAETHIERIAIDDGFLKIALDRATQLYIKCVLPEVIGKWYSRLPEYTKLCEVTQDYQPNGPPCSSSSSATDLEKLPTQQDLNVSERWCYCRNEEEGEMIACDSGHCLIGWFHISCLKLAEIPDGNWVCPDCCGHTIISFYQPELNEP